MADRIAFWCSTIFLRNIHTLDTLTHISNYASHPSIKTSHRLGYTHVGFRHQCAECHWNVHCEKRQNRKHTYINPESNGLKWMSISFSAWFYLRCKRNHLEISRKQKTKSLRAQNGSPVFFFFFCSLLSSFCFVHTSPSPCSLSYRIINVSHNALKSPTEDKQ